jgi:hypothetical protein
VLTNEKGEDTRQMLQLLMKLFRKLAHTLCITFKGIEGYKKLHPHPYHIPVMEELKEPKKAKHLCYCWWSYAFTEENGVNTFSLAKNHCFTLVAM